MEKYPNNTNLKKKLKNKFTDQNIWLLNNI